MIEARKVGYMVGLGQRAMKSKKKCVVCSAEFLGHGMSKYCLDHKPVNGLKRWTERANNEI